MLQNNLAALANTTLFGIERLQRLQGEPGLKGIESGKKPHITNAPVFLPWLGKNHQMVLVYGGLPHY